MTTDDFMRTNKFLKSFPPESHPWTGKVTFSFSYPKAGWIQLAITCNVYVQGVIVRLSNAFDPFPEFARWLNDIVQGNLPSEFMIDEEKDEKIFRALPVNENEFVFEIAELQYPDDKQEEEPLFLYIQVDKDQFLSEFLQRWDDFLENQYDPAHWEQHGTPSLLELDLYKVREFVSRRYFRPAPDAVGQWGK